MKASVRAWPFESKYLRDFAVVEERHRDLRLFPATEQLPTLSRAINREFESGLTTRLAATDGRGDPWRKLQLWKAAEAFCDILNSARPDHLHVQPYYTPDKVSQIAIVQQITRIASAGNEHWFRFFRGGDFLPDVHLSGKRIVFSSHAIERFAQRAQSTHNHTVNELVAFMFSTVPVIMRVSGGHPAFVLFAGESMAALPFKETATEFFFLTTLSPNEINSLTPVEPHPRLHFHYGDAYAPPSDTNVILDSYRAMLLQRWREKTPRGEHGAKLDELRHARWIQLVQIVKDVLHDQGYSEATTLEFHDEIHGPVLFPRNPDSPSDGLAPR
jgi:hypothetical protein